MNILKIEINIFYIIYTRLNKKNLLLTISFIIFTSQHLPPPSFGMKVILLFTHIHSNPLYYFYLIIYLWMSVLFLRFSAKRTVLRARETHWTTTTATTTIVSEWDNWGRSGWIVTCFLRSHGTFDPKEGERGRWMSIIRNSFLFIGCCYLEQFFFSIFVNIFSAVELRK